MHPCDLQLPRADWPTHPHYPRQTLLMRSHAGFRRASQQLVNRATAGGEPEAIGWGFRALKWAMHGHEAYEEGKLYPYLEARWSLTCDPLRAGHAALAEADEAVLAAVAEDSSAALVEALQRHDAVLDAHLAEEEAVVIPALLALSPQEFDTYCDSSIGALLRALDAEG